MLNFAQGAVEEPSFASSLVPWIPLAVGVFVFVSSVWNGWWSTRGVTAALRQLKAMNEALADIPAGAVRNNLENARDRLAERIARSDVRRSTFWRRFGLPGLGILLTLSLAGIGIWGSLAQPSTSGEVYSGEEAYWLAVGSAFAAIVITGMITTRILLPKR